VNLSRLFNSEWLQKKLWETDTEKFSAKAEVGIWIRCYLSHTLPSLHSFIVQPRNVLIQDIIAKDIQAEGEAEYMYERKIRFEVVNI